MTKVHNVILLSVGLLLTLFGVGVGLSGTTSEHDLFITVTTLVPGSVMAATGYLGVLIQNGPRNRGA